MPPPGYVWYSYAAIRIVPRVERGECVNVGVILFARAARFLAARVEPDWARLHAFAPALDLPAVERALGAFVAVCDGAKGAGPIALLSPSERFHWLTAPRSTFVQTAPVHVGCCPDPAAALDDLLAALVRTEG